MEDFCLKAIRHEYHKEEEISAFAFKTGKKIEKLIKEQTENLEDRNRTLEAKILHWHAKTKDEEFAKYFGVTEAKENGNLPL